MAMIIQFVPSSSPCKATQAVKHVSAEIVIFPGIRYERYCEEPAKDETVKRRRPRKKGFLKAQSE